MTGVLEVPSGTEHSARGAHAARRTRPFPRGVGADALAVVTYCGAAVIFWWHSWSPGFAHVYPGSADQVQMMWFLNWVPYTLGHHMNPLFSTLANAPNGINMVNNTSVMFVGLLVSPITVLFGPAAALNTALTLALAGSATSMYFVTRRFTTWRPAAFVAGLVYGVGPYGVAQGASHLQLSFVVLPPIILLLVHDIAVRKEGSSVLRGVILGLLVTAQFFVSVEVLAMTAIFGVLLFAYIAVRGHRMIPAQFSSALRGYASTAGVAVVLLAYPVWYMEHGPGHLTGYYSIPAPYHADLLSPLIPDSSFRVSVPSLLAMADKFAVTPGENERVPRIDPARCATRRFRLAPPQGGGPGGAARGHRRVRMLPRPEAPHHGGARDHVVRYLHGPDPPSVGLGRPFPPDPGHPPLSIRPVRRDGGGVPPGIHR